jgi:hypothetical protein
MQLSIIIVSYNTEELLTDCLQSITKATRGLETETFVVDNNSSDRTVETVKEKFPWVKLVANSKNLGFSKANNLALKIAKGKYILVLNPDTVLESDTLLKMLEFMDKNPEYSMATCKVKLESGELDLDARRRFPTPWRAFCHFSHLSKIFKNINFFSEYYMDDVPENQQHEVDACAGAFMFIRSSALEEVGFFDEDFFFYGEDLDLCYRFRQNGYKIVYTPITKIIHYKGASSGIKKHSKHLSKISREAKAKAIWESTHAMKLFYKKHYQTKYPFFITQPVLAAISALTFIRLLKK